MPTYKELIEEKALEILKNTPEGVRYSDLKNKIKEAIPDANINHIRGTIWNLDVTKPNDVYKAGRGLFRHILFKTPQVIAQKNPTKVVIKKESDFYGPFADFLINEVGECTHAIPLGGKLFLDKWGTPDVIGVERSSFGELIPRPFVIVSAEIKIDTQGLITAFGQACAYGTFSHKTYIVVPENSDPEDKEKLDSLCQIFGIGLIFFDSTNPQAPRFSIRVRPTKHEPDMFYVNKYMSLVPKELFK